MLILSSITLINLGISTSLVNIRTPANLLVNRKIINWPLYFVSEINILSKCEWCMKNKIYYYRLDRIFFGDLLCLPPELLSLSLFLLSEWLLLCLSLDVEWCPFLLLPFLLLEWWLEPWRLFWGDLKISKTICNWYFYSRYQTIKLFGKILMTESKGFSSYLFLCDGLCEDLWPLLSSSSCSSSSSSASLSKSDQSLPEDSSESNSSL